MDHLLRVRDAQHDVKRVPYYQHHNRQYTGPFAPFGDPLFMDHGGNQLSKDARTALFQEWLFFGLLTEYLAVFDIPFDREDFLSDEGGLRFVTTVALKDYLVALMVQEHMRRQTKFSQRKGMRETDVDDYRINHAYNEAFGYGVGEDSRMMQWLKQTNAFLVTAKAALEKLRGIEIDPAVWDSVLVTISVLARILDLFLRPLAGIHQEVHYPLDLRELNLRSMPDLRQSHGWCPNERKVLEQFSNGQPEEVAFFSQLGGYDGKQHDRCTAFECVAHHVDGGYMTIHDASTCARETCSMIEYSLASNEVPTKKPVTPTSTQTSENSNSYFDFKAMTAGIQESIGQMVDEFTKEVDAVTVVDGKIEAVKIPLTKSKLSGSIGVSMKGWNLVAFSHVWSDGLGNREGNALPVCQLARLQNLANGLYSERHHPVPFWIDTLMIPIVPSNLYKEEKEAANLRKKAALQNMEWIYKGASKVLVLDSTLFTLTAEGMSPEERGARIMTSTWSRRLWTLQEGCMKDLTFFQFQDAATSWPTLHNEVLKEASISDWRKKRSVLPKKHPIRKLQKITYFQYNGSRTNANGTQVDFSSPMYQAKKYLDPLLFRAINPVWNVVRGFLEDMSLDWSGSELHGEALRRCMRSMYYRDCTRKADEGLVLASLLSAKPGAAANLFLKTKQLKQAPSKPAADGQDIQTDDHPTPADTQTEPEDRLKELFRELDIVPIDLLFADHPRYKDEYCHWIPTSLLSVNAPAAHLLRRSERMHRHTTMVARKANVVCPVREKGLEIGHDGLRVYPQPTALNAPFAFELDDVRYSVNLREAGTGREICGTASAEWVLIPEDLFVSQPLQCKGILVRVDQWWPKRPGGETTFECLAVITRQSEPTTRLASHDASREYDRGDNVPMYELKRYEKPKISVKSFWKDIPKAGINNLAGGQFGDDKWIVG